MFDVHCFQSVLGKNNLALMEPFPHLHILPQWPLDPEPAQFFLQFSIYVDVEAREYPGGVFLREFFNKGQDFVLYGLRKIKNRL